MRVSLKHNKTSRKVCKPMVLSQTGHIISLAAKDKRKYLPVTVRKPRQTPPLQKGEVLLVQIILHRARLMPSVQGAREPAPASKGQPDPPADATPEVAERDKQVWEMSERAKRAAAAAPPQPGHLSQSLAYVMAQVCWRCVQPCGRNWREVFI